MTIFPTIQVNAWYCELVYISLDNRRKSYGVVKMPVLITQWQFREDITEVIEVNHSENIKATIEENRYDLN